ncbi:hypothetical protein [Scytonema sp. PRP1]|uniref:hypothetical protein n=1 Tax=Scytonema sp. PRP1 TaxID=3120513 RepID=UPI002FD5C8F9
MRIADTSSSAAYGYYYWPKMHMPSVPLGIRHPPVSIPTKAVVEGGDFREFVKIGTPGKSFSKRVRYLYSRSLVLRKR